MTDQIHTHNFYAMGCHMAVWLEHEETNTAVSAFQEVETLFATAEKRMTRFSANSELSQLNGQTGQWVCVSSNLWMIIQCAAQMAAETEGLFDPTMLNALEALGYAHTFDEIRDTTAVSTQNNNENGRFQDIQFDETHRAIKLPTGVRLDLGGIGKGHTAQQAIAYLNTLGPCLIDAGGDLTAGIAPQHYPGWPVGIAAPWSAEMERENLLRLWLSESSLATSGIDYRCWTQNGRLQHHIIDPRTSQPADTDILTVSVLAEDAYIAETWATAALVAGMQAGSDLLHEQAMGAAFINHDWQVSLTPTLASQVQWEWTTVSNL
ncbi:MAG: FAD:protein FMN transferase [Chloroflexi bacterium]|nr:FAD:protein FMN transferase [Chloroflexota bacterium]